MKRPDDVAASLETAQRHGEADAGTDTIRGALVVLASYASRLESEIERKDEALKKLGAFAEGEGEGLHWDQAASLAAAALSPTPESGREG